MDYQCALTLAAVKGYLDGANTVAFDFETAPLPQHRDEPKAALDPHRSAIVGVSLSTSEGSAIYVPMRHSIGRNADDPDAIMVYLGRNLWLNPEIVKVAHNLAFESMFLYAQGVIVQPPVYDTITAAQLVMKSPSEFRGLGECGLKLLATEWFGADMQSFGDLTDGRHFDELDPQDEATLRYACADADYALRIRRLCNQWFGRYLPAHRVIAEDVESPTAVYVGLMKYNGLLMDVDIMHRKQAEAMEHIVDLRAQIDAITGGVNIGANASTSAFKKYLYEGLGLPVVKTTAKQQEAADDQAMILLAEWCREHRPEFVRLFELVQEYRRWGKINSTYIAGYLKHINPVTGRIHPDLMPLAAATGRFACRNPNLQNQVAAGSDPVGVRNFIVAPDGYVLLEADYSQVELRIAAYLSQDETMLAAYRNGEDIHAITTSAVFGISVEEASDKDHPEYKRRRTVAKGTMFGILYGIYARGLMRNLKVNAGIDLSENECVRYIGGIKAKYARLAKWQGQVVDKARVRMYTETEMGRRRYLPGIRSEEYGKRGAAERMAMNTPVQGLAADCLKLAMGRLIVELADKPYIRPTMTVHDSLVFEVRADKVDEAARMIRACMEARPPLDHFMRLVADVATGERYGDLK